MNLLKTSLIVFCLLVVSFATGTNALADYTPLPPIKAGRVIDIGPWNAKHCVFEIIHVKESGTGPWYATPAEIAKSVPTLKLDKLKENPKSFVGQRTSTVYKLPILPPIEDWKKGETYCDKNKSAVKKPPAKAKLSTNKRVNLRGIIEGNR